MAGKFFKECFLQNIYHYDALEVWKGINVGDKLSFGNDKDEDKVVVYKEDEQKKYIIGKLSDDDAKFIYDIIDAGYEEDDCMFYGIVSFKSDETADENKRLKVVVKIKQRKIKLWTVTV